MKANSLTTLAAIVLIGVGGFMAGRISTTSATSTGKQTADEPLTSRMGSANAATDANSASHRKSRSADKTERAGKSSATNLTDRLAKLETIVRGEDSLDRARALLSFIDQLGPGDFEQAVVKFRSLGITDSRFGEYAMLLSAWAKTDPMAALAYAKENTGNRFATNTILTTWAAADPESAIRWAEANHEGDDANPYMASIIRAIASTDSTRATQLLTNMPRSQERGEALDAILPQLFTKGVDATRSWIDALTDPSLRNGAMLRAAEEMAQSDPAGTAAWLAANPGEATQRRMDDVYSAWAQKDQQAALTSLSALPTGENRTNALRGLVSSVAVRDPKEAVAMMDRFPNDVNDRVVQNLVWHSLGNDPSLAINQISRIADQGERERMYSRTLGLWLERDAAAANAWLKINPVPVAVQDRLNNLQQKQQ